MAAALSLFISTVRLAPEDGAEECAGLATTHLKPVFQCDQIFVLKRDLTSSLGYPVP